MRWLLSLLFVVSVTAHAADEGTKSSDTATAAVTADAATSGAEKSATDSVASKEETKVDNRKESEIPLNLDAGKKAGADGTGWFRILLTLSMLGVVGTGAFMFLKKQTIPKGSKHQTQIKVLQQHYLGPKKSLAIVRVAGESILIGVTDHNISMIKSLSLLDDEIPEEAPKSFGKVMGNFSSTSAEFEEQDQEAEETPAARVSFKSRTTKEIDADEEFAISGIKDIVSKRLKGMRSFQ